MDTKLIIAAVVAGALLIGGVGYFAMNQGIEKPPPAGITRAGDQLKDELPPKTDNTNTGDKAPTDEIPKTR